MSHQPEQKNPSTGTLVSSDVVDHSSDSSGALPRPPDAEMRQRSVAVLLEIASEITRKISAILDPDRLLHTVIPLLKERFGLYYVHVYTLDAERKELCLRAGYGEAGEMMLRRGHRIPLDAERSLVAQAARTRVPVMVPDVSQAPNFLPNPLLPKTKSEIALPMVVGDEVLGVFDVQDDVKNSFPPSYQDILFTLTGQIAVALQNARFVERIEQNLHETQVRLEIGELLAGAQTEAEVLDGLLTEASKGGEVLVILARFVASPTDSYLEIARVSSTAPEAPLPELKMGTRLPTATSSLFQLVAEGEAFVAPELQDDPCIPRDLMSQLSSLEVRSLLLLPLRANGRWMGFLGVLDMQPLMLDDSRRFRLQVLAEQGAEALQQAQLRDQLSLTQFSVDHAPAAILWIRPDGTLRAVNATMCTMLGYSELELLALPSISRLDPNMIPGVWAVHWRKVKQDRRFTIETEYRTKQGKLIPVEVTANYLEYGDQEYNCVFVRDIAHRKQAEAVRERFALQLHTAAEIAEQVGAILDPDRLLATAIPLLKERFELYHAHVYVLEGDRLVLKAGYGRIGNIMLQQGHAIPLDHPRSLVARAARSREPVVVNDVASAPDFLPNLLLPRTKSEVAVPIVMGDQVLGVFDVQSDQLGYFQRSDIDVLLTFSGQLANALYSAMLFEQQNQTREQLRSAAQTVRAVFDAMTESIMVTDMMGHIIDINEAGVRLHGYESRDALLGQNAMALVTKSSWSRMAENVRRALETGQADVLECTMLRQDGSTFDAEQSSALLWDATEEPEPRPRGVVSITRDITERKRWRREIARFQALAENAVDAILLADFSGIVTYANPAARRLFAADKMGEASLADFWPSDDAAVLVTEVLPAAGERGWQGEATQVRADGSSFEAALTVFTVDGENGEPIAVAIFVRDISDRKAAEVAMRRFALQLRTAADVSAQVTAILDPTALLESVVPLLRERFGLYHLHVYTLDSDREELVMQVGSGEAGRLMRQHNHAISLDQEPSLVAKAARTGEVQLVDDVRQAETFLPNPLLPETRSEVAIPMLVGDELIGVFDVQDSTPSRFAASDVDVFSALAAQIAIALRNARYFEEIQQAAARLREIDRLKSEFLANMSHELRTPLNSILGYAEVMLMGIDGELTPDMQEDVEAIFENGKQLLRLINDVLDLTKIEAGRLTLNKEPVDVLPLLEEARAHNLGLLHRMVKPVEIFVSVDMPLPRVMADPARLAQILNNLLSNAVKFTEAGEIHLRADHNPTMERVCIEVVDSGVGIPTEMLPHLFERFHQVDGSSTRRAEGTGLGLAITKHLVDLHDGEISVTSEVGRGSAFTVCLPVAEV